MDNEQLSPQPNPDKDAQEAAPHTGPENTTETPKPAGWDEFSAAKLGPDGKKRDAEGNQVQYPHNLAQ